MKKHELIRSLIVQYFICYTGTMFAAFVLCAITQPDILFPLRFLWQTALFALAADMPCVVYYSEHELNRREFWVRTAIHTVLIESILLVAGHWIGMYEGVWGGVVFAGIILAVDVFVRLIAFLSDVQTADEINTQLRRKRERNIK